MAEFGRPQRRRLGLAHAWLGVVFYSSEIPAPANEHVIAACGFSVEQAGDHLAPVNAPLAAKLTRPSGAMNASVVSAPVINGGFPLDIH